MPKMKTKRGAAKRFKLTGSGQIKRSKAFTKNQGWLTALTSKEFAGFCHICSLMECFPCR